jgi:hypothetical protein
VRRCTAGIRNLDVARAEAEQDRELSASGIARRRAEICDQAMSNWRTSDFWISRRRPWLETLMRRKGSKIVTRSRFRRF